MAISCCELSVHSCCGQLTKVNGTLRSRMRHMPRVLAVEVTSPDGQVAIVDATWQDYPLWDSGDTWVAFKAPSLADPDNPPYPGFAVATRRVSGTASDSTVTVEVWLREKPVGLREVHRSVFAVGDHGVEVGNEASGELTSLAIPQGRHDLQVWVDGNRPDQVQLVAFVLPKLHTDDQISSG